MMTIRNVIVVLLAILLATGVVLGTFIIRPVIAPPTWTPTPSVTWIEIPSVPPTETPTVPVLEPMIFHVMPVEPTPLSARAMYPLHLRAGPGVEYPVVGYVDIYQEVKVRLCWQGWAKVDGGWLNAWFTEPNHCQ